MKLDHLNQDQKDQQLDVSPEEQFVTNMSIIDE
jgi:hypothetical protein